MLPIRKIKSTRVALTSYYGRVFIDRSERRVNDWGKWIVNKVYSISINTDDFRITEMITGNSFDHESHYPHLYTSLSMSFREFKMSFKEHGDFYLVFYPKDPETKFGVKTLERDDKVIMGKNDSGDLLLVDAKSKIYIYREGTVTEINPFETWIGLDPIRAPVEFATCGVMGEDIPVGVVLGYLMGFSSLCKLLNVTPRRVPVGKRLNLTAGEWAMMFEDQSLVFDRDNKLASMVLAGFREYHKTLALFPLSEFDHQDVYLNLLEEKKIGVRYIREITLLENLFIDPITRELLAEMKEPLVFRELLIRASELLLTNYHPHEQDSNFMRIKGYERMSGLLYSELVRSIRTHNSMPGKSRYGIEMNPYAVWIGIQEDSAKDQVSDINPIQDLKQKEAITFSGDGGRTSRTMVARTRVYHRSDMGVTSESTVDSSDVAVNAYMSANPKFNSLRGVADKWSMEEDGLTSLLSTSAMTSIGALRDD